MNKYENMNIYNFNNQLKLFLTIYLNGIQTINQKITQKPNQTKLNEILIKLICLNQKIIYTC